MNGLSTLNRLLGKRNKDVSKSTSNLSRSTSNLDTSSQYNKIVPLAAMTNAPFEQTFRITVLLPRDQLYVARIGAKTRLASLMEMVCSDKQLDATKYLFRHPADFHQAFELDLTIGEVGLNEIRLMSRKELEHLQNNEYRLSTSDIFRMHQKNFRETSISSSDLSRTSKVPLKTTSPYSSTNSLNSMDSSGLSSSSRGGVNGNQHHAPVAPMRKKRLAPRPPSQNSIPEKAPLETTVKDEHLFKEPQLPPYSKKHFHVSSPNLYGKDSKSADSLNNNNNNNNNHDTNNYNGSNGNGLHTETVEEMNNIINTKTSYSTLKNRPTSMYIIREPPETELHKQNGNLQRSSLNGTGNSLVDIVNHSRTSSNSSDVKDPRDFQEAKKTKAPAPPPRGVSLGPKYAEPKIVPTPSPRAPSRTATGPDGTRDSDTIISETDSNFSEADELQRNKENVEKLNAVNSTHQQGITNGTTSQQHNVSKVMLNVEQPPTVTKPTLSTFVPEKIVHKPSNGASSVSIKIVKDSTAATTNGHHPEASTNSKPSTPIISKVHIVPSREQGVSVDEPEESNDRRVSNGDNSSDDDIKIYNIESGQEMRIPEKKDFPRSPTPPPAEEEEQWTYTLPAPPKFADSSIKSGEYDEKQRFFDLQSTYVENTTLVTDRMTIVSDETEKIRPIIREKVLLDESLISMNHEKCPSPTVTLTASEGNSSNASENAGREILISSEFENGYRGGSELRESMIQTLEKRREQLKESELQDLKESIEGGSSRAVQPQSQSEEAEETNESDIMKCAKLNEETMVDDYTVMVGRDNGSKGSNGTTKTSKPLSEEIRKIEVISELNQVIKDEHGLKGVLNGNRIEEEEIPGANMNSLSNFKISTYNKMEVRENGIQQAVKMDYGQEKEATPTPESTTISDESEEDSNVVVRRKISTDSIHRRKLSSDEEDSTSRGTSNGSIGFNNKKDPGPVKRRSLTVLNNTPRNINRSDSFHSTRSDYIQSLHSANGLKLTPRSTSYISLIGAQKFENRFAATNRRKSTSEMSICDSPSLQSLEVIKNILNTSRSNLSAMEKQSELLEQQQTEEIMPMAAIKRNSFTDISTLVQYKCETNRSGLTRRESLVEKKIDELHDKQLDEYEEESKPKANVDAPIVSKIEDVKIITANDSKHVTNERVVDVSNESKSDDEKLQNKQLSASIVKQPQTTVVNITTTSTTVASTGTSVTVNAASHENNSTKEWKYRGPPTVNFTTWSERPKIDVSIKSDRDYRFGGSSTLPRGYKNVNNTTKINLNGPSEPLVEKSNGVDCSDSQQQVPLNASDVSGNPPSLDVSRTEPASAPNCDRLPIVRAVEYKKNVVPPPIAQKPIDKPYFYETFSRAQAVPNGTATINRLTLGHNKFQPVVRGFKPMDEKDLNARNTRPVSMIESTNISTAILKSAPARVEKLPQPAPTLPFGQNTLRRTGLKDKILAPAAPVPAKPNPVQEPTVAAVKATPQAVVAPPPPPVAPKVSTPVVRGAIVKKQLPAPLEVDSRGALLDAIRSFSKDKLRRNNSTIEQTQ
ncbi:uncharacterized protein LOC131427411 isoform X2 [Malaya genurostris]|uniref:uncharacterized protein LOC131427411 isoform X2 n=1 Tax=Malaya genurostris TaxID=325434 RepID=UPI0026F3FD57|nr:uncharacterized protein LOC131427411 isoform X2 [Malaya genurostris]